MLQDVRIKVGNGRFQSYEDGIVALVIKGNASPASPLDPPSRSHNCLHHVETAATGQNRRVGILESLVGGTGRRRHGVQWSIARRSIRHDDRDPAVRTEGDQTGRTIAQVIVLQRDTIGPNAFRRDDRRHGGAKDVGQQRFGGGDWGAASNIARIKKGGGGALLWRTIFLGKIGAGATLQGSPDNTGRLSNGSYCNIPCDAPRCRYYAKYDYRSPWINSMVVKYKGRTQLSRFPYPQPSTDLSDL